MSDWYRLCCLFQKTADEIQHHGKLQTEIKQDINKDINFQNSSCIITVHIPVI